MRILSVHKSKGLEFPVVFLAELETEFNKRDIHADLIADTSDAVGLQVIEPRSNTKLRSLAHEVIGEKRLATMLAEEMRILYVATTRARDRLILTAGQKRTDCGKILANGLLLGGDTIPAWLLKPCKNALEWVLYGLSDQRVLHQAFGTDLEDHTRNQGLFDFRLYGEDELKDLSRFVLTLRTSKAKSVFFTRKTTSADEDGRRMLAQVKSMLSHKYAFAHAVQLAAKSSVTKLTHQDDMFAQRDYSEALDRQPVALAASSQKAMPEARTGRLVGTAAHLVISTLDLKKPVTLHVIEKTRDRLVKEGAIPARIAEEYRYGGHSGVLREQARLCRVRQTQHGLAGVAVHVRPARGPISGWQRQGRRPWRWSGVDRAAIAKLRLTMPPREIRNRRRSSWSRA